MTVLAHAVTHRWKERTRLRAAAGKVSKELYHVCLDCDVAGLGSAEACELPHHRLMCTKSPGALQVLGETFRIGPADRFLEALGRMPARRVLALGAGALLLFSAAWGLGRLDGYKHGQAVGYQEGRLWQRDRCMETLDGVPSCMTSEGARPCWRY